MDIQNLDPLAEFVENLGLSAEADGIPRIAGRILGLLIVEEGPFCFDELAEHLQVSRGSISTNTRLLEERGMIERFTVPGQRRDLFRLGDDSLGRWLDRSLERMQRSQHNVNRCLERLDAGSEPAYTRLTTMSRFYEMVIANTYEVIERWRAIENGREANQPEGVAEGATRAKGVSS